MILSPQILQMKIITSVSDYSLLLLNIVVVMMLVPGVEQLVGRQHIYWPSPSAPRKPLSEFMKTLRLAPEDPVVH